MGAAGFICAMYMSRTAVVFGSVTILIELSTIFTNTRWLSLECKMKGKFLPVINSVLLFTTYFLCRMIFHTWWSIMFGYPYFIEFLVGTTNEEIVNNLHKSTFAFRACGAYMILVNVLSQMLNIYWFFLICKQVRRNIKKLITKEDGFEKAVWRNKIDHFRFKSKDSRFLRFSWFYFG